MVSTHVFMSLYILRGVRGMVLAAEPYFEFDPFLPRTVMALLSWGHLEHVLPLEVIPAHICFANLFFFSFNGMNMYQFKVSLPL